VKRKDSPAPTPYARAAARLARRDHTTTEIRRALSRDGFSEDDIETTVRRLVAERALDDGGFAVRYAKSRIQHQALGRNRIRRDLQVKGVSRAEVDKGVATALEDVSEGDALEAAARRHWKLHEKDEPRKRLRRLWAFLLRRGFPADLVQARLRALWPRWQDALDGLEMSDEDQREGGME
jgi:regulatory protein